VSSSICARSHTNYPYLIIRVFAAIYQREYIEFRVGPPAVRIANRHCSVQHPAPFEITGKVSSACRALLIAGVQDAVRRLPFRMCLIWGEASCTYVETDSTDGSAYPPSGGCQMGELDFKAQHYPPLEADSRAPA